MTAITDSEINISHIASRRPLLVAPDQGDAVWMGANRLRLVAGADATGGAYGLIRASLPDRSGPPLHVHHVAEEAFFVLAGTLRIVCGAEELLAPAGAFAVLPRGVPHTFIAHRGDVEMLTLLSPGGAEGYFLDAGVPADGSGLTPPGPPDIARMQAAGPAHEVEVLGPPLTPR